MVTAGYNAYKGDLSSLERFQTEMVIWKAK